MKYILKMTLAAILLTLFLSVSAHAQSQKIATVDLGNVFTNYYKTKLAQTQLDSDKAQVYKDEKNALDELKKAQADYKQLLAQADDSALSDSERDKKKQAADAKLKEMQDDKTALDQYDRSAKTRLADEFQRVRDKILSEIQAAVEAQAKTAGDTLVLDSAAQTANGTPVVVFNAAQNDLTDAVVKQLNAGAPIDLNSKTTTVTPIPITDTNLP